MRSMGVGPMSVLVMAIEVTSVWKFRSEDRSHCQVTYPESLSGSRRVATSVLSTCGCCDERVTLPNSSRFLTVMVSARVATASPGSVAVTSSI